MVPLITTIIPEKVGIETLYVPLIVPPVEEVLKEIVAGRSMPPQSTFPVPPPETVPVPGAAYAGATSVRIIASPTSPGTILFKNFKHQYYKTGLKVLNKAIAEAAGFALCGWVRHIDHRGPFA
jgi:hypothetical protein